MTEGAVKKLIYNNQIIIYDKNMKKLRYHLKILFDNAALVTLICAGYAVLFFALFFKYASIGNYTTHIEDFKTDSMPLAYLHFLLIGTIAFLYFMVEERISFGEALTNELKRKQDSGKAVILLLFNGIVFLYVFLLAALSYYFKAHPTYLFPSYFRSIFYREFLDYFLLGIISCLFGYLTAQCKKRKIRLLCYFSYQCIFGIPMLWMSHSFGLHASDNILTVFLLNMTSMMPDGYQYAQQQYHLCPVQAYQIVLALFWITFLLWCSVLCRMGKNTKGVVKWGGALFSAGLFALCLIPHVKIDSGYRNLSTSQWIDDQARGGIEGREREQAPFEVESYDMTINAFLGLFATVEAEVSDSTLDRYVFTLFEGCNIIRIEDQNGKIMEYDRDGHYLTVFSSGETTSIRFTYAGIGDPFYCEAYAIWLPGGLPFFPMAGKVPVYSEWADQGWVNYYLNNNHLSQDAFFHVKVNTLGEVYCPLEQTGYNEFSGYGDGFFVLNGMYDKVSYGDIEIVYPYAAEEGRMALEEGQVERCLEIIQGYMGEGVPAQSRNRIYMDTHFWARPVDSFSNYFTLYNFIPEFYLLDLYRYLEGEEKYHDHD